ncbi:MAG: helix-hairpin-helix domain-containing protein [Desulfobacteraceae bacterium]|nr:helix-hairpin-helix domain-containing protein [Desulfobacteraceae bacterium]
MFKRLLIVFTAIIFIFSGTGFAAQKIDINKANKTELSELSGIGEKYAERIIDYRNKNGNFTKIEDLLKVKGIGEKTLLKNKDRLTVGTDEQSDKTNKEL